MCGIGGILGSDLRYDKSEMADVFSGLQVRGPDSFKVNYIAALGFLAHARLSIIDPYENSNQPLTSTCGRFSIVYNGEIYNYREIRNFLTSNGLNVQHIDSDTHIILEGFRKYGVSILRKFRGMFAMCITDNHQKKVYLIRDMYGSKPLYFSYNESGILSFASYVSVVKKCRSKLNELEETINQNALIETFLFRGPVSNFYNEISELPPGTIAEFDLAGAVNLRKLEPINQNNKETTSEIIADSVMKHLVSDVPVGIMLSGGVDSTIISQFGANIGLSQGYTFKQSNTLDESSHAAAVADDCNLDLENVEVAQNDILEWLHNLDIPITDPSAVPIYSMAKRAKADGIKVLLSGEGADEIFGGYRKYKFVMLLNFLVRFGLKKFIINLLKSNPIRGVFVTNENLYFTGSSSPISTETLQELFVSHDKIKDTISCASLLIDGSHEFHTKIAEHEIKYRLNADLLKRSDLATMAASVECRVPFVDVEVINFAQKQTFRDKFNWHGLGSKYNLRSCLRPNLRKIVNRPKTGFELDLIQWIELLEAKCQIYIKERQFDALNYIFIGQLLRRYKQLSSNHLYVLWAWITLENSIRG